MDIYLFIYIFFFRRLVRLLARDKLIKHNTLINYREELKKWVLFFETAPELNHL